MKNTCLLLLASLLLSCTDKIKVKEMWVEEIRKTEQAFAHMADTAGIEAAFIYYAANEAVLNRNNQLIKGKKAIEAYFANKAAAYKNIKLSWEPELIEIAEAGDLAYTYGSYQMVNTETNETTTGIFHTVWKRQESGVWRYVWD